MFDKIKFANILRNINETYENQVSFSSASGVNRTYISQFMNMKLDSPPTPKILQGIAAASKGITTYDELMQVCGYTDYMVDFFFDNNVKQKNNRIPIVYEINYNDEKNNFVAVSDDHYILANFILEDNKEYFAYKISDDSMLPLLGIGDIAIIEKKNSFSNGETCLFLLDNKNVFIRKIVDFGTYIELHTTITYNKPITLSKEEIISRNFKILGKVIRVENSSAFK